MSRNASKRRVQRRVGDRPRPREAFSKGKPQKTEQLDEASEGAFAWMPGPGFTARPKGRLDLWGSTCSVAEQGDFVKMLCIS